jgi:hypothetical protein
MRRLQANRGSSNDVFENGGDISGAVNDPQDFDL